MSPRSSLILSILFILCVMVLAISTGSTLSQVGCESSALNARPISVPSTRGIFTVFEASRNPILPPAEKCYYVAPIVLFESKDGTTPSVFLNEYGEFATVAVTLLFDYPTPEEVAASLRRSGPRNEPVTTRNVARLAPRTIRVEHPIFRTKELVDPEEAGGVAVASDAYTLLLETQPGRARLAREFVKRFRNGAETLTLSYQIPTSEARLSAVNVTWNNVASSKGFAEFKQIAEGRTILASQAFDAGMTVAREMKATLWQEYEDVDGGAFLDLTRDIARSLLDGATETFVDVKELQGMLAPYKIDLKSENLQPDVITTFAADVKNLSKTDFSNKYFRDYSNALRQEKDRDIDTGAKVSVFKIFGGGANYKQRFHNLTDTQLKERLERENYFRQELDHSFQVKMDGKIVRHVSVQAYENLNLSIKRQGNEDIVTYRVRSKPVWIPIALASSQFREHLDGVWKIPPISLGGN